MTERICADCGTKHKETLLGKSRELIIPNKGRIFFCSAGCRKRFVDRNGIRVYDRKP